MTMTPLLEYATAGERRVTRKLVNAILGAGYMASVNDGEEWTVKNSTSTTEIIAALGSTEEDVIRVSRLDKTVVGVFVLIWGNDETGDELMADHTDNDAMQALYDAAQPKEREA